MYKGYKKYKHYLADDSGSKIPTSGLVVLYDPGRQMNDDAEYYTSGSGGVPTANTVLLNYAEADNTTNQATRTNHTDAVWKPSTNSITFDGVSNQHFRVASFSKDFADGDYIVSIIQNTPSTSGTHCWVHLFTDGDNDFQFEFYVSLRERVQSEVSNSVITNRALDNFPSPNVTSMVTAVRNNGEIEFYQDKTGPVSKDNDATDDRIYLTGDLYVGIRQAVNDDFEGDMLLIAIYQWPKGTMPSDYKTSIIDKIHDNTLTYWP